MAKRELKTFSVSEVNTLVRSALEERLPSRMVVSGEISDWKHHYSGHCYFSLKDASSQLPCVMWARSFKKVKFAPENGMAVLAKGHIEAYVPAGKYQFYAEKLEPAGVGALQLAFEQMRRRLQGEVVVFRRSDRFFVCGFLFFCGIYGTVVRQDNQL